MKWPPAFTTPAIGPSRAASRANSRITSAICDMPLGSTRALGHTAMINFLGKMPDRERLLAIDGLAFHDYGKQSRPGRKLGHCTILKKSALERNLALSSTPRLIEWT